MSQDVNTGPGNAFPGLAAESLNREVSFARIFDQMVEALVVIAPDLTIRYANQPFFDLFGYEEGEIIGKSVQKLGIDDSYASQSTAEIAVILKQRKFWQGEVLRRAKGGRYIPVLVNARSTVDEHGEFSGFIGTYLDLRQVRQSELRLKNGLTDCVIALARAIEGREVFKMEHHSRVSELSVAIALELDMDTSFIEGLSLAAALHDIGKIHVPSELLNSNGRLTDREMKVMRQHPVTGHAILKHVDLPWPVANIVLQHHERLDGSGYPYQLQGNQILLGARILAVADVVDAMHADKSYRSGYDMETCLEELESGRGSRYDAKVVDACTRIIRDGHFTLTRQR